MEDKAKYESIVQRILNLQKLVEQGVGGEAENARRAIETIVKRYGLSLDEILADEKPEVHWWRYKTAREKELLLQCLGVVLDSWQPTSYTKGSGTFGAKLTKLQYAELSSMYDWHRANMEHEYKEMISNFFSAYAHKHMLFPATKQENDDKSPVNWEKIKRMLAMQEAMSDKTYRKQLEEGNK